MPRPISGVHRVLLHAAGARYQLQYHGFGVKHRLPELHKQGKLVTNTFDTSSLSLVGAETYNAASAPTTDIMDIGSDRGGVSSVPYLDASQSIGLTYYDTENGSWEEIDDPEYSGKIIFQRDGTENTTYSCASTFLLPPNPLVYINFWRGEPNEDEDRTANPPCTRVYFGENGNQYCLVVPYGEPAYMTFNSAAHGGYVRIPSDDKSKKLPAFEGIAKGQRVWLLIGACYNRLCVAMSRGSGSDIQWVTYPIPDVDNPAWATTTDLWQPASRAQIVGCGTFKVEHNAGQIAFRWWPIYHYSGTNAVAWAGKYDAGYYLYDGTGTPADAQLSASNCTVWQQPVRKAVSLNGTLPNAIDRYEVINSVSANIWRPDQYTELGYDTTFSWYASWTPTHWTLKADTLPDATGSGSGSPGYIDYYQAPMLFTIQCIANPYVMDRSSWPATTDVSSSVQAISVQAGKGDTAIIAGLKLKNNTGAFSAVKDNQLVTIELGYLWDNGDTDLDANPIVFSGYIATPAKGAKVGPIENCDVVLYDATIRLRDEKADDFLPDFQFHSPVTAAQWILKRAGFAAAQQSISGSSSAMFSGYVDDEDSAHTTDHKPDPLSNALKPKFGTELVRSLRDIADRDNESLVYLTFDYTEKFIMHKTNGRLASTDGTLYTISEDADWSAKTKYRAYDVTAERVGMDPDQYADTVIVRGKDATGAPIIAYYHDPARITTPADPDYGGGWRRTVCIERDSIKTVARAQAYAYEKWAKLSRRSEVVTVETDLLYALTRIDRIKLDNTAASGRFYNAGVRGNTYRVESYNHVWQGPGTMPRTTVVARSLETT